MSKKPKICMLIKNVDVELMQRIQKVINEYNSEKSHRHAELV